MSFPIAPFLACICVGLLGISCRTGRRFNASDAITRELQRLYDADQNEPYPQNVPSDPHKREEFFIALWTARLKPRYDRVLDLIRNDRLRSGEDYYIAGMIVNHGIKPEDSLLAHSLFIVAALKNHPDAKWASAAALDNYLTSMNQPQLFGTVYGGRRALMTELMTDSLRREFCVPTLAQQESLAELRRNGNGDVFDRQKIQCQKPRCRYM